MKITMTAISEIQRARFYLYKKQKHLRNVFLTESPTLSKNQDNLRYVFIYKNQDTLRYAIFIKKLKLAFIYKTVTLCDWVG